jgi:hypothetical protein
LYLKNELKNSEGRPTAPGWLSQKITLKKVRNYLVTLLAGLIPCLRMRVNVLGVLTSAIPRQIPIMLNVTLKEKPKM